VQEIEVRFRKEDPPGLKEKRMKNIAENLMYSRKVCSLVSQGPLVIACVFHVISQDNTGEFDPYGIERMKNAMQMIRSKQFAQALETEINEQHTFKYASSEPHIK
jgi:hypothetical protein